MAAPDVLPIRIPDEFTVWVASDLHGQLRTVDRLLAAAGLTDGAGRWIAAPATALVVTGDMVDRGPDSLGLVRRLASLRDQAEPAGGRVVLLEGNHEAQVLGGLDGEPEIFRALMLFGGAATLASAGLRPDDWEGRSAAQIRARVDRLAPDLLPTLWTFAPYARWRDVLLVHGGPVPFQPLERFERSARRLWIRDAFFASSDPFPDAAAWEPYQADGIGQVVFGHTPVDRPTLRHAGQALNIDTWRGGQVTLARLQPDGGLDRASFLAQAAEPRLLPDTPITADEIRALDETLPGVVDAWITGRQAQPDRP